MKNIALSLTVLALVGCSSLNRRDSNYSELDVDSSPSHESTKVEREQAPPPTKEEAPPISEQKPIVRGSPEYVALQSAIKSGNDEKIYTAATDILTKKSSDVMALNALAMYHFKKGRLDLAKSLLNKAIGFNGNMSPLYSNLGVVQLALGESREAIQSFKKSLQINSSEVTAAANLGSIYIREKDYGKAAVALEVAHRNGVKDAKFLNNYGILMTAQGKYPEAKKAYEQSLKLSPDNKDTMLNLSILLIDHLKKYEEGLQVLGGLKFIGGPDDSRNIINALENKALTGLNQQ